MCRCLAQLSLDATDDIYFVVAFLDETAFAQKYPSYHIRPHMLGVVLVSYCSAGDGGALAILCHPPAPTRCRYGGHVLACADQKSMASMTVPIRSQRQKCMLSVFLVFSLLAMVNQLAGNGSFVLVRQQH